MPSRLPGLSVHVDGGSVTTAGRGTRNVSGARRGSNIGLHTWAVMEPACSRLGTGLAGAGDPTAHLGIRACFAAIRPRREDAPSRSHYFRGCPSLLRWLRARARLRRRSLPSRCCCAVAGVEQGAPGSRLFPEEDAACLPCLCFLPVLWGESPHGRLGGLWAAGWGSRAVLLLHSRRMFFVACPRLGTLHPKQPCPSHSLHPEYVTLDVPLLP